MNSKERFYRAVNYKGFDRPPTKYYGNKEIDQELIEHFGITNYEELLTILGDDFRHVYPRYIGPKIRIYEDGSWEGLWGERYIRYSFGDGDYDEVVYLPYKNITRQKSLIIYRKQDLNCFPWIIRWI